MNAPGEQSTRGEQQARFALLAGSVLCLVAAGGLLWWRYGGAVFNDMVSAAVAWCF
jgi:hypothetical protein